MEYAEFVQTLLVNRADALDALQIVGRSLARGPEACRASADGVGLLLRRCVGRQLCELRLDLSFLGFRAGLRSLLVHMDEMGSHILGRESVAGRRWRRLRLRPLRGGACRRSGRRRRLSESLKLR